jgi:hypothetical protein
VPYIHTNFRKDWFRHSKVLRGDTHTDTDTDQADLVSLFLFLFFQNKESCLKGRWAQHVALIVDMQNT